MWLRTADLCRFFYIAAGVGLEGAVFTVFPFALRDWKWKKKPLKMPL